MSRKGVMTVIIVFLVAFILSTACLFMYKTPGALALDVEYVTEPVQDYYTLGQTFAVPEAKVSVNGTSCDMVKQVLHYPDGNAYSAEEYVLSNPGKYTVRYYANYNGKSVYAEDDFVVKASTYGVSSPASSVQYGNTGAEKGNIDGLVVSLASGDEFTYNKPINLNDKKKGDSLLSFFAIPEIEGRADVKEFMVRLTDAVDENNFIEIVVYANSGDENEVLGEALYYGVRGNNQTFSGTHFYGYNPQDKVYYDGNYYKMYKDINYTARVGYPSSAASLAASRGYGYEAGKNFRLPFSFAVDYAERKVFGPEYAPENYWSPFTNKLIADLDDSLFFDELWSGFTTGEVYLSIYSSNYVNSSFNFVITEIYEEDFTKLDYEHELTPTIIVDLPQGDMPYAIKDSAFTIFPAKAYSAADGEIGCQTLVYRDYNTSSKKLIPIKDGAFVPTSQTALYSIVYRATDSYGNHVEKVIDLAVKQTRSATLALSGEDVTAITGVETLLKQPVISDTNGEYTMSVKAILGEEEIEILPSEDGEYRFYTLKTGEYTIKYCLTDYNGPIVQEYKLNVNENANSVFVGTPYLPKAFVKNVDYVIPEAFGVAFKNGATSDLKATAKYSFDDGEKVDYTYGDKIEIVAENKVTITYSLENALEDLVVEIPVVDVGVYDEEYHLEKYFYSADFVGEATENGLNYKYTATDENKTELELSFVKPVLTTSFGFSGSLIKNATTEKANASAISFIFTDTEDSSNVLEIKIMDKDGSKLLVSINGSKPKEISKAIASSHEITYNSVLKKLIVDDYEFEVQGVQAFAKNTANFEIKFSGVSGDVDFSIKEICGQLLTNQTSDYALPLCYLDVNSGKKVKGDKIIVKGLFIEDIVRFYKTCQLTITAPDGSVCKTIDGITMNAVKDFSREYEIEVNQLGAYKITGKYGDGFNNNGKIDVTINVYDEVVPVITINEEDIHPAVYAGKEYKIASATATDNLDGNVDVTTIVIDTEGKTHIVTDSVFNFSRAGRYRITYIAVDSSGNVGYEFYDVIAVDKEK